MREVLRRELGRGGRVGQREGEELGRERGKSWAERRGRVWAERGGRVGHTDQYGLINILTNLATASTKGWLRVGAGMFCI